MTHVLLVGFGGFIGSTLRYLLSFLFVLPSIPFPVPVIVVNLLGSFILGLLLGLPIQQNSQLYAFLIPGLIGGFTTFSSFSGEAIQLLARSEYAPALIYVSLNVGGGLVLCFLGIFISKIVF